MTLVNALSFAAGITLPILILLVIGALLRRSHHINDNFVKTASQLCFKIAMPALLGASVYKADLSTGNSFPLTAYGLVATIACYLLLELLVPLIVAKKPETGVVIQAAFRSNMGIVGLAYCANAYGEAAYPTAALYIAINTIVYNVLSVITLARWHNSELPFRSLCKNIGLEVIRNPIIIGISTALILKFSLVDVPTIIIQSVDYLSQLALPLALLCAGASLNFKGNKETRHLLTASLLRLIIVPLLMTACAYGFGFRDMDLGILFLLVSAPAAAASYVMVCGVNGNRELAANIIAVTTIASIVTTAIGAAVLSSLNWA